MTWAKVDDNLAFHPKVLKAGNEAMGVWVRAMSYSAQQLTDGFIPREIVFAFGAEDVADQLVVSGLWHEASGGYEFNDWCEYQPSAADEKERRSAISRKRSESGRVGAGKRWQNDSKPIANENDLPSPLPYRLPSDLDSKTIAPNPNPNPNPKTPKGVNNAHPSLEGGFNLFWAEWPRLEGKKSAFTAWSKAVKKAQPAVIIAAAKAFADSPYRPEKQFIPYAATWLNGERWTDPLPEAPEAEKPKGPAVPYVPSQQEFKAMLCQKHTGWPANACDRCAEEAGEANG